MVPGRIKYLVASLCGSRCNWIIGPDTGGQNGSKKAKYEKISCLEEPDVFSGDGKASWKRRRSTYIKIHQKLIFFIN
jgi:hypothetical protein